MIVRTATQLKESLQQKASALWKPFEQSSSSSSAAATTATTTPNNIPQLQDEQQGSDDAIISVIYIVRHGDRFDYANPSWMDKAQSTNNLVTDPPLSALGHRQASETSDHFASLTQVSKILVSPYLRVIQTACPTSDALHVPLSIEEGLAEAHATPDILPTPSQRFAYFPQIDPAYQSSVSVQATPGVTCSKTGKPCESFAAEYVRRMKKVAAQLEREYQGQTILCFSHAASVALVAALLKCSLHELKFAPCGIFKLKRVGDGPWELCVDGSTNPHVSENSPTTYPWGFSAKHFQEEEEETDVINKKYYGSSEGIGLDFYERCQLD